MLFFQKRLKYSNLCLLGWCITLLSNFLATQTTGQSISRGLNPEKKVTQYVIDSWTVDSGLPTNSINDSWYNPGGYLWFASYNGLLRFDGVRFTSFDQQNVEELVTGGILDLYHDGKALWVGTNGGGLMKMEGDSFQRFDPKGSLQGGVISAFIPDGNGGYWVGSRGGMAKLVDTTFSPLKHPELGRANIYDFAYDLEGRLWVATNGFGVFYLEGGKFVRLSHAENGLPSNGARAIYCDKQGQIWIGTDNGIARFSDGKLEVFPTPELPNLTVNCFLEDRWGTLWIGTDDGLGRYRPNTNTMTVIGTEEGLSQGTIESLTMDHEGNLWVSTYRGGINRISETKFLSYGVEEGVASEVVNVTFPEKEGVWVGTDDGLSYIQGQEVATYKLPRETGQNRVRDIKRLTTGQLWLATHEGLIQIDEGKIIRELNTEDGLSNDRVRVLLESKDSTLWVGTSSGLDKLVGGQIVQSFGQLDGLENEFIMSLLEDDLGNLWVGTNGGGIFQKTDLGFKSLPPGQGLNSGVIFQLFQDTQGWIWVGTNTGVSVLLNEKVVSLQDAQGIPVNAVFQVQEDKNGDFWFTTDQGALLLDGRELRAVVKGELAAVSSQKLYGKADGMLTREVTGASIMGMTTTGELWVPTLKGVTIIDPRNIPFNATPPIVAVERVIVDGEDLSKMGWHIPAGRHRLTVEYTALTFAASESVKFKYRLAGYEEDWVDAGTTRIASYTNLPPGEYDFQVIAANLDGVWNRVGASVTIVKNAKLVQTWYFWVAVILFVGVLLIVLYYIRLTSLQSRNMLLEELVEERTQNLQLQSDSNRMQAEELETINSIVQTINREYELPRVLDALLTEALKLFPQSEKAAFLTFDSQENGYHFSACRGMGKNPFKGVVLSPKQAFSTFGDDYQELEEGVYIVKAFRDVPGKLSLQNVKSSLVMTIKVGAFPEGFLFLFNTVNHRAFDKSDSARLKRFRDHALSAYSKARAMQELEDQKGSLESYIQDLDDSVRYARRIQEALLPKDDQMKSLFPESFIYYQPKQVVSGDFYWMTEYQGNKVVAAVDCTGHGVPGAFMSMLGNALLHQIINERGIIEPGQVLKELNRLTRLTLHQKQTGTLAPDGMDVALCTISPQKNSIKYAGAKRPFYFFRENQLHVIKGDTHSIGGLPSDNQGAFIEHQLKLDQVQSIYLFSDGYADQFHESTGKKFMMSRFKNLIREVFPRSMEDQRKEIERKHLDWRGSGIQVDDILVMGIRL